jgi:hypothetical protein
VAGARRPKGPPVVRLPRLSATREGTGVINAPCGRESDRATQTMAVTVCVCSVSPLGHPCRGICPATPVPRPPLGPRRPRPRRADRPGCRGQSPRGSRLTPLPPCAAPTPSGRVAVDVALLADAARVLADLLAALSSTAGVAAMAADRSPAASGTALSCPLSGPPGLGGRPSPIFPPTAGPMELAEVFARGHVHPLAIPLGCQPANSRL